MVGWAASNQERPMQADKTPGVDISAVSKLVLGLLDQRVGRAISGDL
jgi:hypothetical protein